MLRMFLVASILAFAVSTAAVADALIAGCVEPRSLEVIVPVSLHDAAGTPLGGDRQTGERIASIALRVAATPDDSIESLSLERSGELAHIDPMFETASSRGPTASWLVTFHEENLPTVRTDEAVLIANIIVKLRSWPSAPIHLRLDRDLSMLSNQGGTIAETRADESLELRDGCIQAGRAKGEVLTPGQENR